MESCVTSSEDEVVHAVRLLNLRSPDVSPRLECERREQAAQSPPNKNLKIFLTFSLREEVTHTLYTATAHATYVSTCSRYFRRTELSAL